MSKKWIVLIASLAAAEVCFTTLLFFLFRYDNGSTDKTPVQEPVMNITDTTEHFKPTADNDILEVNRPSENADNLWAFYLVNRSHLLPFGFEVETAQVQGDYVMDARCADYAKEMIAAALADGIDLMVCSAYRTPEYQQKNYDRYVNRLISEGYSEDDAIAATSVQIADPYASEHCAGLALDIISRDWWNTHNDLTDVFDQTPEYEWLAANSWKYGFILRYKKDKENITGYIYEPWHYRFIGLYHAEKVYNSDLCLEEYFEQLEKP